MIRVAYGTPALILAPMEGVVDSPTRALLTERGGFTYCISEFLRVSQEALSARSFLKHVPELSQDGRTKAGTPLQIQLLGGDPERLALSAVAACKAGAPAIDLNFGCPAPTVNKHDGGATLLKYPDRIRAIVAAVRSAVPREIPVSAKLRLGWDDPGAIHVNADAAEAGGADWITIHGRTRLQGYQPPAYWAPIGEVRRRLSIPVVANGEIRTLEDFMRCRDETGAEHFMIGRGALADPNLQLQIAADLGIPAAAPEAPECRALLERFASLCRELTPNPGYASARIKQWSRMIHHRYPISWYESIRTLKTVPEILACVPAREA